jgi:RNA polymerase sigma-70 factor (ECF subfamily)
MMEPQQLRTIIASAREGDGEAYAALLEAYGRRLYGYFLRATRNHHDAEDLLSEISLRLVRQLGRYEHQGRFEQWLFRIAANLVRDRIRRSKARPKVVSLSAGDDDSEPLAERLEGNSPAVDAELRLTEASDEMQAALNKLDEATRQMILLRHLGEMSFRELAEVFQCPLGTVLAKVHRGLKTLRKTMEKNNGS